MLNIIKRRTRRFKAFLWLYLILFLKLCLSYYLDARKIVQQLKIGLKAQ